MTALFSFWTGVGAAENAGWRIVRSPLAAADQRSSAVILGRIANDRLWNVRDAGESPAAMRDFKASAAKAARAPNRLR